MIKVEVIEGFTLTRFNEIKDLVRGSSKDDKNTLYVKDTFKCEKDLADYLLGGNSMKKPFVRILEVEPKVESIDKKPKKIYNKAPKKK